jgi:hypothetical protein
LSKLIDRLERRFRRFAVPNVTPLLVAGQVACWFVIQADPTFTDKLVLQRAMVLDHGQWWRLLSFLLLPPITNIIFALFAWYLFYLMGTALENHWGTFRYNLFLLIGYLASVVAALVLPTVAVTNAYLYGSVFLAFAFLYPNFELLIFFILPVKIKWLALITWITYFWQFARGNWGDRGMVVAAVLNFLIFFWSEILGRLRAGKRRMEYQRRQIIEREKPFHRCAVCGITEKSHPQMDFRYCSKCDGSHEYCDAHLRDHEHVQSDAASAARH